ncbi:hypothetical protein [Rosenbergiella epipactidis]|uniref:hypothetical protein n=1 Tax=Rosenbergiella epipactidis TaxID=1544694 RepID=UPI001F4E8AB1|nr:hypothetical protein [Rosenbergiella epipactidis]
MKSDFLFLIRLMAISLMLFLFFDFTSELLASSIIFLKKDTFSFSWERVFASFCESGYVGGLILGVGLWIKIVVKGYKEEK